MTFFDKFFHSFNASEPGFLFMWGLLMIGIAGTAITLERTLFLSRRTGPARRFMDDISGLLTKEGVESARRRCAEGGRMALAEIIGDVLAAAEAGEKRITAVLEESILRVVPELEKRTGYLATIGNVSTLTGLMGTIYGLILSFASVGKPGIDAVEKSTLLASGIAAAMNTTFMGLLIAIPAIVVYSLLKARTQRIIDEIDEYSLRVANLLTEQWGRSSALEFDPAHGGNTLTLRVTGQDVKVFAEDRLIKPLKH